MSESWDDYADEWDDNGDDIRYSEEALRTLNGAYYPAGLDILDFGCGTGLLTEKLSPVAMPDKAWAAPQ